MTDNLIQPDQVEWNLSSALIAEIQSLLSISNRAYLGGNLARAFWCLKTVKFRFIQSLDKEERGVLKELEKKFIKAIRAKQKPVMAYLYEEYTEKIMDFLQQYGYLIPKKKDSKRIS